ncbi:3-oxo-5-alpha-steroid 4-dehydrogenase-domain-containing protein [Piptocephalis cylindrospora]|uniref:3-oxo-5-alpha-steroid 4-dehydrogenase-domain-containing protein n=1 Tax=Piptocephalis cylindrospora TaxID=1907219 RepID=A0A4V1IYA8_9FUNG|nr:3-oxo-5-alpha-steroid 4-dehydrogenase-domain-containing protein [Piptocephalis cylindrospora]|eukprot:RKP13909.1 3-oxo-5-alpha-steroid 4-dehydrogenase-domain-containing protein [Piptocephalis cylindrospora]
MRFDSLLTLSLMGLGVLVGCAEHTGLFNAPYGRFQNPQSRHRLPRRVSRLLRKGALPARSSSVLTYAIALALALVMYSEHGSWGSPYHVMTGLFLFGQYGKRLLESRYVHWYSGEVSYAMALYMVLANLGIMAICIHSIFHRPPAPSENTYPALIWCLPLMMVAWAGNLYHHYILRSLRTGDGDRTYAVPRRGWFLRAICPHYFFEVLAWLSFALLVNRRAVYGVLFLIAAKLAGRSHQTRDWSWRHLDGYPRDVKRMVPFLY